MSSSATPMNNRSNNNTDLAIAGTSTNLDSQSATPSNKMSDDAFDIKGSPAAEAHEIPQKPLSEYILVMCLCLMVAFGGFVFGWDTGTISGFVNMTDFKRRFGDYNTTTQEYYLSNVRTGLIVAIFNIGCAVGGLTLGRLGDMQGRRLGLMAVILVYVVGIVIQISASDKWYQYFIGRIVSGLGVGGIAVLSPTLISETAPKHLRGTCVSFYQLMITLGIFLGYCTNYGTKTYTNSVQWRLPLGLCFLWAIFMIGGMVFVPESPRYLIEKGRFEEAKRSIAKSNKLDTEDSGVLAEVDLINAGVEAEKLAGNARWGELFSPRGKILQRVIMGCVIQSLQQLTGNNYFFYYGTTIFQAVGLDDSFQTSIILGVVNFMSTFVGLYTVEKFGRRKCLLWGSAAMSVCFVVFASVGVTKLYPNGKDMPTSKSAGNAMIFFTCLFIFFFATTWAPIAYVIVSETYPLRVKNRAMAMSVGSNWIWGFLIGFFTPFITSAIGFYYGYVFMGCLVFSFFYVFFFVCETKGLTLEEVNEMYEEGVLPWKSESWVPALRRDESYDVNETHEDGKPFYKRFV
ncbi:Hexose transporter 2 [Lachancea thermotolerans]